MQRADERARAAPCHARNDPAQPRRQDGMVYLQINRGTAPRCTPTTTMPWSQPWSVTAKSVKLPQDAEAVAGRQGHHPARHPLGSGRHQDDLAAAQHHGQDRGCQAGRLRGVAVRRRRQRHRVQLVQRLDRRQGRPRRHAPAGQGNPARHHPRPRHQAGEGDRRRGGRAPVHRRRSQERARGLPHQHDAASSSR